MRGKTFAMYDVVVMKAVPEHIDDLLVIENLCFTIPWSRQSFLEEIGGNDSARYFTAIYNGSIIGYAGIWLVGGEGHITNIAVHPGCRKMGVGSKLLSFLIDEASAEGVTDLTLEVRRGNTAAQALYRKFGFELEGVRKGYYADNREDAFIMWKRGI